MKLDGECIVGWMDGAIKRLKIYWWLSMSIQGRNIVVTKIPEITNAQNSSPVYHTKNVTKKTKFGLRAFVS